MNPGLNIFKRMQRFQGGTGDVPLAGRAARKVQDLSIEALQNLPEWLKKPVRKGVGRVVSNTLVPISYEVEDTDAKASQLVAMAELFSPKKLGHTLASLAKDQPAYGTEDLSYMGEAGARAGRPLLREYFDLPTQDEEWMYSHKGKQYRLNPGNKNEAIESAYKKFQQDSLDKLRGKKPEFKYEFLGGSYLPGHDDPWNFDLSPKELDQAKGKPLNVQQFGRQVLETLGHPAILETGGYPPEPFFANPDPEDDDSRADINPARITGGGLQRGTGDVMDLERGNWPVSEDELKTLPDWLAHLLRGIPEKHTHGSQREQFMPRSVPVFQGPQGRYYDPRYSADDERIMAAEGDADVEPLKLASGSSNLPKGFTAFWPGGGRWEGPSQVAAGSNILGGQPWQYYDIGNPQAPWIGLEGPRGSLGQWVDIPGESRRGRVIDVKQKGYGGYGILKKGQYDRKGNWIPGTGGQGGGTIPGGPFQGWTPEAMGQWHEGTPPSQMGYEAFTGNTAGPGGQQLAYETTSYNIPGYGWVPRATLANAQASNNLWDYLNPFGGTSKGGSGTGDPTQRGVGMAVGTASNLIIPGLGFVTGPIARYITSLFQKNPGITREQIVQAVAAKAKEDPALVAPPPAPPVQGGGFDPFGNPARGREYWSGDFGRGIQGGPNTTSNLGGVGFNVGGSGTVGTRAGFSTAIGFGGSYGGGSNAGDTSRFMSGAGYSRPYTSQQWANLPGSMKYPAPTLSNAFGGITPRMSYEDYVAGFHAPGTVGSSTGPGGAAYSGGGPQGIGGGKTSFKPNLNQKVFAMGTSDVNPGLKIFHQTQLKRKKPKL